MSINLLDGMKYIGHRMRDGWKKPLPFYRFTCKKHGDQENYPQGYGNELRCPECLKEITNIRDVLWNLPSVPRGT
jgi:hypothetical protein